MSSRNAFHFSKPLSIDDLLGIFQTADLGLTENVGGSGTKLEIWFRKRSRENWTLQAPSPQVKNKWVSTFEKILWNQAIKNRESRLTELSSMGIGSKPSLDLKPSEDNISNRTINTDLTHKGMFLCVCLQSLKAFNMVPLKLQFKHLRWPTRIYLC